MNFQIIPFDPALHQPGVSQLYESIKNEFPEDMFGNPPKTLTELSLLPGRHYWVVVANEKIAGTIGIIVLANHHCGLKGMFLASDLRGTDAAASMLRHAIDQSVKRNCHTMYLGTMEQFKAAQRFYEKWGFHRINAASLPSDFPANAVDTVFYVKNISGSV